MPKSLGANVFRNMQKPTSNDNNHHDHQKPKPAVSEVGTDSQKSSKNSHQSKKQAQDKKQNHSQEVAAPTPQVGDSSSQSNKALQEFALDELIPRSDNRKVHTESVKRLAEDIKQNGLAQLPLVRKTPQGYEIISGHHRLEAYKLLLETTKDDKWAKIPVIVDADCDDSKARVLMWSTNIASASLSKEEFSQGLRIIHDEVEKDRLLNPKLYEGKRTNDIVAEKLQEKGVKISGRTVARKLNNYVVISERKEEADKTEKQEAITGLSEAIEDLNKALERKDLTTHAKGELTHAIEILKALEGEFSEGFSPHIAQAEKTLKKLLDSVRRVEAINKTDHPINPSLLRRYRKILTRAIEQAEKSA